MVVYNISDNVVYPQQSTTSTTGHDTHHSVHYARLTHGMPLFVAVEGAILRHWRFNNGTGTTTSNWKVKAKMGPDRNGTATGAPNEDGGGPGTGGRKDRLKPRGGKKEFRPTSARCCNIGRKVAKRELSCDMRVLEVVVQYNYLQRAKMKYNRPREIRPPKARPSKIPAKLSPKLRKCLAGYPKYFEKCCKYREQFYRSMDKCKRKKGAGRRKCRQSIRKRFRVAKGSKGSKTSKAQKDSKGGRKASKASKAKRKSKSKSKSKSKRSF